MTMLDTKPSNPAPQDEQPKSGRGHWMMMACCIPMLTIAVVLVATGVAGAGAVFAAMMCAAMMWMMMRAMSGGHGGH